MSDVRINTRDNRGDGDTLSEREIEAIFDPDALYNEGMAHYRRRRWREAKNCFEQVQIHQPNRRGVDALLRELDIFIQLATVEGEAQGEAPLEQTASHEQEMAATDEEDEPTPKGRGWLILAAMVVTIVVVVGGVLWYSLGLPPFGNNVSEDSLRNLGQAYMIAQQYDKALSTYAKLVVLVPSDPEALNGFEKAKAGIYQEAQDFEQAGNAAEALKLYQRIMAVDSGYKDVAERIPALTTRQDLEQLYADAQQYLDRQSFGEAEKKLLDIRGRDPSFRPGTISDGLFEVYIGRGSRYLDLVADEIIPAPNAKPAEPAYQVAAETLSKVRQAMRDLTKALEERPSSAQARQANTQATRLNTGLARYVDWAWSDTLTALEPAYADDPAYLKGKVALILCDSHLHQGDYMAANQDYASALQHYQAMAALAACDGELAQAKADGVGVFLTPTTTPTPTLVPTSTPTATPRPTITPTQAPTDTPTLVPTPQPTESSSGSGGSSGGGSSSEPEPKPTKKSRK
jgi:tetratricopeptide (TPR) repeat protein